jgi:hypothetical protein
MDQQILYKNIYLNILSKTSKENLMQMKLIVYNLILNSSLNQDEKESLVKVVFYENDDKGKKRVLDNDDDDDDGCNLSKYKKLTFSYEDSIAVVPNDEDD